MSSRQRLASQRGQRISAPKRVRGTSKWPRQSATDTTLQPVRFSVWLLGQTALLTAIAFYFGYVRSRATFDYFSVDLSIAGLTVSDFALRSVNSLAIPITIILVAWLASVAIFELARLPIGNDIRVLAAGTTVLMSAATCSAYFLSDLIEPLPLMILATLGYSYTAASRLQHVPAIHRITPALGLVGLLALFLAFGLHAQYVGISAAKKYVRDIQVQPEMVLRSDRPIGLLDGDGVKTYTASPATGYRYEVQGLRLLVKAGGNYLLVRPANPTGSVFYLPASADVRIETVSRN